MNCAKVENSEYNMHGARMRDSVGSASIREEKKSRNIADDRDIAEVVNGVNGADGAAARTTKAI